MIPVKAEAAAGRPTLGRRRGSLLIAVALSLTAAAPGPQASTIVYVAQNDWIAFAGDKHAFAASHCGQPDAVPIDDGKITEWPGETAVVVHTGGASSAQGNLRIQPILRLLWAQPGPKGSTPCSLEPLPTSGAITERFRKLADRLHQCWSSLPHPAGKLYLDLVRFPKRKRKQPPSMQRCTVEPGADVDCGSPVALLQPVPGRTRLPLDVPLARKQAVYVSGHHVPLSRLIRGGDEWLLGHHLNPIPPETRARIDAARSERELCLRPENEALCALSACDGSLGTIRHKSLFRSRRKSDWKESAERTIVHLEKRIAKMPAPDKRNEEQRQIVALWEADVESIKALDAYAKGTSPTTEDFRKVETLERAALRFHSPQSREFAKLLFRTEKVADRLWPWALPVATESLSTYVAASDLQQSHADIRTILRAYDSERAGYREAYRLARIAAELEDFEEAKTAFLDRRDQLRREVDLLEFLDDRLVDLKRDATTPPADRFTTVDLHRASALDLGYGEALDEDEACKLAVELVEHQLRVSTYDSSSLLQRLTGDAIANIVLPPYLNLQTGILRRDVGYEPRRWSAPDHRCLDPRSGDENE